MSADLTGQRLGHYEIESILGLGGMSTVYRAIDSRLDRPVALKVISEDLSADEEFRQRFVEEAKAASAIDHVNVVPLYDFGEADPWLFIAMRLVDGTDLARELVDGPLPRRRVLDLLSQVGAALDMLHQRGLVHLDVKPANILITRNESAGREHVYLADFGLTRRGTVGHRTASGDFLGSPTYASPEHLRGDPVLPSSDLYSLTCVLFSCLAGRAPFTGTVKEVVAGHLRGEVPSLSALTDLPPALDRVIARGMAGDPALRYSAASELLGAARRALSDLTDDPEPAEHPPTGASGVAGEPGSAPRPDAVRPDAARPDAARPQAPLLGDGPATSSSGTVEPPRVRTYRPPATGVPRGAPTGRASGVTAPVIPAAAAPPGPGAPARMQPGSASPPMPVPAPGPRPAAGGGSRHRAASGRPRWPWVVLAIVVLMAVAAVIVVLATRG